VLTFWQNIPIHIDPIIFAIGNISIRWYSLGYVLAILTIYLFLKKKLLNGTLFITLEQLENILFFSFFGALLGGKIGYVIFYDWTNFITNPLLSFWPFSNGSFVGFYGMSFHGGLIGALFAGWIACKRYKLNFWKIVNFIIPVFPLGYFWGRIGNFMNRELYGRVTENKIGMHFSNLDVKLNILRHPSQLYEALGEGILLFFILSYFSQKELWNKHLLWLFLIFYGIIRFVIEFFRQPDAHLQFIAFDWMTMGQILCLGMIGIGISLFAKSFKNHKP
jgi:phosphatidylglycerol:prolipoprotein diacylglycerol transferase